MIVLGVDPGKATGISAVGAWPGKDPELLEFALVDYSSMNAPSVGRTVGRLVEQFNYVGLPVHLVVERFVPEKGPKGFDATPIEVIGEIKAGLRDGARWAQSLTTVTWPLRVEKERIDNKVLKRLGLHLRGKQLRHVNDSTRHVVNRLVAVGHRPTMEKGWPDE